MKRKYVIAITGALLILFATFGVATTASAGGDKPSICHPVNGKGETGYGWNIISPDHASSHIDESKYPSGTYWKHSTNDNRHDVYADSQDRCPGYPVDNPDPTGSTTPSPSVTPTQTSESPTPTDDTTTEPPGDDPSDTPITTTSSPSVVPLTPSPSVSTPSDPVVSQNTSITPTETTVTKTHKSGKKTVTVTHYNDDVTEEGF